MPHQCTTCGHTFPDGSKEMLSGCPDCGGNKFQFYPHEVPDEPPEDAEPPEPDESGVATAVGRAANTVRDLVGSGDGPAGAEAGASPPDAGVARTGPDGSTTGGETGSPSPDEATATSMSTSASSSTSTAASEGSGETAEDDAVDDPDNGRVVSDAVGLDLSSGAMDPNDALDDAALIEDGPSDPADPDATDATAPGDRPHTDALTDKEWPAVSRPDDAEDTAQADARSSFFAADDAAVEGAAADDSAESPSADASAEAAEPVEADGSAETADASEAADGTASPEAEPTTASDADAAASTGDEEPDLGDIRIAEEEPIDPEDDAAADDRLREVNAPDDAASTPEPDAVDPQTATDSPPETEGVEPVESPDGEASPGLEELRAELNEQFESIRIVEPGQYELNLMELYERQEYIIALQEDGRYVVEVPDTWE